MLSPDVYSSGWPGAHLQTFELTWGNSALTVSLCSTGLSARDNELLDCLPQLVLSNFPLCVTSCFPTQTNRPVWFAA